jgi:hypothetical protein
MCRYTIRTRRPLLAVPLTTRTTAPVALATRARPGALRLVTRIPWAALALVTLARPIPLRLVTLAAQQRLITQSGDYLVTQDGRRLVVGVCFV